ncbi:hypothetical protein GC173_05255 [bacterium]|nr:hypothetical protein [bacterium]
MVRLSPPGGSIVKPAIAISLAALIALTAPGFAQKKPTMRYDKYNGFAISEEPVLPATETHPSIWFRAADLPTLRARRTADAHAKELWAGVVGSPLLEGDLPELPPRDSKKDVIHKYYGAIPQIAALHGLIYQLSEDPAEKKMHAEKGKAALARCFDGYMYEIDPKPSGSAADEIYQALWMQNAAAAYDWLHERLTPEEDARIRATLVKQGNYIRKNLDDWADRPHNHLSKPAWGLASLALTLSSEPAAKDWLRYGIAAGNQNTRYFFSADGIYREGSQYYIFSAINWIPFLYHYRNVSGVDEFPAFQPAHEWPIVVRNGHGWMPNIEDSFIRPYFSEMVAGAYKGAKTRLSKSGDLAGVLMWNFHNTSYDAFEEVGKSTGFNYTGASWDYNLPMTEFLCYDPSVAAVAPDASPTIFLDGGETVFRNNWSFEDPSHRYLLFQGVAEADNHMHEDHLSFIIHAENQMMASDSGYTRSSYGEKIRKEWYATAESHNVVLAGGKAPVDVAQDVTPLSRYRIDSDWFDMEEKEAPYAAGGKLRRLVAFLGNDHFLVLDRVNLPAANDVTVLLHGGRGDLKTEGSHARWNYQADTYGPAAVMDVYTLAKDAKREVRKGEQSYIKGDYAEFPYTRTTVNGDNVSVLQLIVPGKDGAAVPAWKQDSANALSGTLDLGSGTSETVVVGGGMVGDVQTDAALAVIRRGSNGVEWFAVVEGKSLKVGNKSLLSSENLQTVTGRVAADGSIERVAPQATKE